MRTKRTTSRVCQACGIVFVVPLSVVVYNSARYCSAACYNDRRGNSPITDVLSHTNVVGNCWEWNGGRHRAGYGLAIWGAKARLAHRVALEIAMGQSIPRGFMALHTCDNRPCVRNDDAGIYVIRGIARPRFGHLFLGTQADNITDMWEKRRNPSLLHTVGTLNGRAKLTDALVIEMRRRHDEDGIPGVQLAREYGISQPVAARVLRRASWKHLA